MPKDEVAREKLLALLRDVERVQPGSEREVTKLHKRLDKPKGTITTVTSSGPLTVIRVLLVTAYAPGVPRAEIRWDLRDSRWHIEPFGIPGAGKMPAVDLKSAFVFVDGIFSRMPKKRVSNDQWRMLEASIKRFEGLVPTDADLSTWVDENYDELSPGLLELLEESE